MARDYPDSFVPEPVDRVAGRVISRGQHHEFEKPRNNRESWDTPPNVLPPCYTPDQIQELIGTRKGSLVVVGYLGRRDSPGGKKKHILLVRCDCGKYEERVAKRWRRPGNEIYERCQFCDLKEDLKLAHLPYVERDRLDDLQRTRNGLPSRDDMLIGKLQRKLVSFYSRQPTKRKRGSSRY